MFTYANYINVTLHACLCILFAKFFPKLSRILILLGCGSKSTFHKLIMDLMMMMMMTMIMVIVCDGTHTAYAHETSVVLLNDAWASEPAIQSKWGELYETGRL